MTGNAFPVVAIGASAGGLEALSELVGALETTAGIAYVVVQHLNPEHKSLLSELLGKKTAMPVMQVRDGLELQPDHVYVIPPNKLLALKETRFVLTPRDKKEDGPHHPVDVLFVSLAKTRAQAAIGVVLSGGDSDGTIGVQAIKSAGGITFAQTPESARVPSMPHNAIETGCIDFVLDPTAIALEINRLVEHPYLRNSVAGEDAGSGEKAPGDDEALLRRIFHRLRTAHSVDFTHYKRSTLQRRLARRMALRKVPDLADYATLVEQDGTESAALYQDFLIRVTGFFRDPESFESLRARVFPILCEGRSAREPLRIWVPGCASGEEVYSIAIALVDYLGDRASDTKIQIFGTDVSETAIELARSARYLENVVEQIPEPLLRRFFVKENSHYCILKSIRDLCIFARQDVTRDPPFSRLDLVSCRNLLIYLDSAAQRRVMQVFHYSLRPHAFLMLGPSESVGVASDLFELIDKQTRIYVRKSAVSFIESGDRLEVSGADVGRSKGLEVLEPAGTGTAESDADRILLSRYAPASLLVDDDLHILQFRGETGPYLEHASGPSSLNLRRVARPELLVELSPAIDEARETGGAVRREGLSVGNLADIIVEVIPLSVATRERTYLIVFEDGSNPVGRRPEKLLRTLSETEKDRRVTQLEREVHSSREFLRATLERHAAINEELKSAHEEVLSANEEFQSTNEELETAKEELQSSNEELVTTNDELRARNRELAVLNSDLRSARDAAEQARAYADAIIGSVREPLAVLDGDLRILRANASFVRTFGKDRESVAGRTIDVIGFSPASTPELLAQLDAVLTRDVTLNDYEIRYEHAPGAQPRTLVVNGRTIPGDAERDALILLSIEDITERNDNANDLRESNRRKDEFLAMLAHELRNPLTPVAHAIHLLRQGHADEATRKLYDLVERQSSRLVRLVDDLLDVARISRGHIEIRREITDFVTIVRSAVDAARPRIESVHHDLLVALPAEATCVDGDPVRLEQVVSNLLDNAAKYTPPGGRIQVELTSDGARRPCGCGTTESGSRPRTSGRCSICLLRSTSPWRARQVASV